MQDIKDIHSEQDADRAKAENIFYDRKHWVKLYVESYDDVPFWYVMFKKLAPQLNMEFVTYTRREQHVGIRKFAKGKDILLKNVRENQDKGVKIVGPNKLICVDSDYDYLIPDTPNALTIQQNRPYIFQTYAYSIENFKCLAESLDSVCVEATYHTELKFDFVEFLKEFSNIVYDLFLYSIYSKKNDINYPITIERFCQTVNLGGKHDIRNNANKSLQKLKECVDEEIRKVVDENPEINFDEEIAALGRELAGSDVTKKNTYLFIKGHTLFDAVVGPMVESVVCKLIGSKFNQISDETAMDKEATHHLRAEYKKLIYKSKSGKTLSEPTNKKVKSKKNNKEMIYHPRKLLKINKEFYHYNGSLLSKIKDDIAEYLRLHPVVE